MLGNKEVMAKNINKYMKLNKISRKMSEKLLVEDKQTALTSLRGGLTMNTIFVYFVRLIIPHSLYKQTSHYQPKSAYSSFSFNLYLACKQKK